MRVEPDLRRFARLSQRPNPGRGRVVFAKKKEKPVGLRAVQGSGLSQHDKNVANFMGAGRARGTVLHHDNVISHYHKFCDEYQYDKFKMSSTSLVDFLFKIDEQNRPFSWVTSVSSLF